MFPEKSWWFSVDTHFQKNEYSSTSSRVWVQVSGHVFALVFSVQRVPSSFTPVAACCLCCVYKFQVTHCGLIRAPHSSGPQAQRSECMPKNNNTKTTERNKRETIGEIRFKRRESVLLRITNLWNRVGAQILIQKKLGALKICHIEWVFCMSDFHV